MANLNGDGEFSLYDLSYFASKNHFKFITKTLKY